MKLPAAADCRLTEASAISPLFAKDSSASGHLDVEASMSFNCSKPGALASLDLSGWFAASPTVTASRSRPSSPAASRAPN